MWWDEYRTGRINRIEYVTEGHISFPSAWITDMRGEKVMAIH